MNTLDKDFLEGLGTCNPPCLSLYQPTHRTYPDNKQDPIRYRNLLKILEDSLKRKFTSAEVQPLMKPFSALTDDRNFWANALDGLAILGARNCFRIYTLQRPVPELAIVADSFHIKPLMRIFQSADRYQVLGLNRQSIKLYEGNRDALDEIEPAPGIPKTIIEALGEELTEPHLTVASYGGVGGGHAPAHHGHGGKEVEIDIDSERFFRAVDRGILKYHSQPSGLPLILAALPEHHHLFHSVSHNRFLLRESVDIHPDALPSTDELRTRAWNVFEPHYLARLTSLIDRFKEAEAGGLGEADLLKVAKAVVSGRVTTLLVDASRQIPGRLDESTGDIAVDEMANPEVDDVLDDLGALASRMGCEVVVIPSDKMPTDTGIAAIYRY